MQVLPFWWCITPVICAGLWCLPCIQSLSRQVDTTLICISFIKNNFKIQVAKLWYEGWREISHYLYESLWQNTWLSCIFSDKPIQFGSQENSRNKTVWAESEDLLCLRIYKISSKITMSHSVAGINKPHPDNKCRRLKQYFIECTTNFL